jgi:hypothetical protein
MEDVPRAPGAMKLVTYVLTTWGEMRTTGWAIRSGSNR